MQYGYDNLLPSLHIPNPNKIDPITLNKSIQIGLLTVTAWSC